MYGKFCPLTESLSTRPEAVVLALCDPTSESLLSLGCPLQVQVAPNDPIILIRHNSEYHFIASVVAGEMVIGVQPNALIIVKKDDQKLTSSNKQDERQNKSEHEHSRIRTRTTRRHPTTLPEKRPAKYTTKSLTSTKMLLFPSIFPVVDTFKFFSSHHVAKKRGMTFC
ncbi:hypothetical protein ElyMa_002717900 [Elysia marginata]|uniref:Uncharacterized protein n=1 Tax=Elysia marginata TaxID=1093978 RepID=A0AAV4HHL9_9GAST|nr:hypothetical protein ElyMa_002717900 [Elysia marginata]